MASKVSKRLSHDVAVIGGGPAGLRLAYRLAQAGRDTVLYDDRSEIGQHKICTGIVSPEAFEQFDLSDSSILSEIQKVKFFSPFGSELEYVHLSLLAYVVDRTAFDHRLGQTAREAGVEIRANNRVTKMQSDRDGVEVETRSTKDPAKRHRLRTRMVAIATGVSFKLNKAVGLGVPEDFLNAAQAHINVENVDCTWCYVGQNVAPGAFAWVVPLGGNLVRVGLMTEGRAADYFRTLLQRVGDHHNSQPETVAVDYKPIAQKFVGQTCRDRVIAVGEAAGHVKTTTGGGIYYGLLCAALAAQVINEALQRNRFDEGFLSRYQEAWKREIWQELELGYRVRKAITRLSDRKIEGLFVLARTNGILPLVRKTAQFDWHAQVLRSLLRYGMIRRALGIKLADLTR